jgi:hypothetical protein
MKLNLVKSKPWSIQCFFMLIKTIYPTPVLKVDPNKRKGKTSDQLEGTDRESLSSSWYCCHFMIGTWDPENPKNCPISKSDLKSLCSCCE